MSLVQRLIFEVLWDSVGLIYAYLLFKKFLPEFKKNKIYVNTIMIALYIFAGPITMIIYYGKLHYAKKQGPIKVKPKTKNIAEIVSMIDEEANRLNERYRIPRYLLINKKLYDRLCIYEKVRMNAKHNFINIYTTITGHDLQIILSRDEKIPGVFQILPYAQEVRLYLFDDLKWVEVKDEHAE